MLKYVYCRAEVNYSHHLADITNLPQMPFKMCPRHDVRHHTLGPVIQIKEVQMKTMTGSADHLCNHDRFREDTLLRSFPAFLSQFFSTPQKQNSFFTSCIAIRIIILIHEKNYLQGTAAGEKKNPLFLLVI